jgi:hypothetical protein
MATRKKTRADVDAMTDAQVEAALEKADRVDIAERAVLDVLGQLRAKEREKASEAVRVKRKLLVKLGKIALEAERRSRSEQSTEADTFAAAAGLLLGELAKVDPFVEPAEVAPGE